MRVFRSRWFFLPIVAVSGIFLTGWMLIGQQVNRRIDENALTNAGKTGEEWLTYGLSRSRRPMTRPTSPPSPPRRSCSTIWGCWRRGVSGASGGGLDCHITGSRMFAVRAAC